MFSRTTSECSATGPTLFYPRSLFGPSPTFWKVLLEARYLQPLLAQKKLWMSHDSGKGSDVSSPWTGINEDTGNKQLVQLLAFSWVLRHSLQPVHVFVHFSVIHLVSWQMSMKRPKLCQVLNKNTNIIHLPELCSSCSTLYLLLDTCMNNNICS